MMKKSIVVVLFFLVGYTRTIAQDTIFLSSHGKEIVKVVEIDNKVVKYRKLDNPEGPVYSLLKNEIIKIRYSNGSVDVFNAENDPSGEVLTKEKLLQLIKERQVRVFVVSFDDASIIHAKNALQNGTPWTIVDDKATAQFIVRFVYAGIGFGDKKGKAQFLDPKTEAVVFETGSVNTTMSWDMNTKRGVIDKVVRKEIGRLLR